MSKKNYYHERNPLKMVIYILVVLFFMACIGYLLIYSGKQKEEYKEEMERVSALETGTVTSEEQKEEETADTRGTTKEASMSETDGKAGNLTPTPVPEQQASPTPISEQAVSPTPVTEQSATPTLSPEQEATATPAVEQAADTAELVKDMNILVLNGTKRPGVAGYWKTQLENVGYKNVVPATYTKTVGQETVIWASKVEYAKPFLELFPDAQIQVGSVQDGIELQAGVTMPENNDVFIIIGNKDVKM